MDVATIVGFLIGGFMVFMAIFSQSLGNPEELRRMAEQFFIGQGALRSAMIVLGGTFAATLLNYPVRDVVRVFKVLKKVFATQSGGELALNIQSLVELAELNRRDPMALDERMRTIPDPFLKKGLILTQTQSDATLIEDALELDIEYIRARHRVGQDMFRRMSEYSPAFGMVGTVIGLILMLVSQVGTPDPSKIMPGMAVALITTFYGVVLSNLAFKPIAGKLRERSEEEIRLRTMQIQAVLAIHRNEPGRVLRGRLEAFLPSTERTSPEEELGVG